MSQAEVAVSNASARTLCTRFMMIKARHMRPTRRRHCTPCTTRFVPASQYREGNRKYTVVSTSFGVSLQHLPRLQPAGHEQVLTGVSGTHLLQNPTSQGNDDVMERCRCVHVGRRDCISKLVLVTLHLLARAFLEQVGRPATIVGCVCSHSAGCSDSSGLHTRHPTECEDKNMVCDEGC